MALRPRWGSSQSLATRRAKDGWMAPDRRTPCVDHSTQPAAACPRRLAVAAPDERHALRARTANRCQLAACGWTRPRFPSLLLLPRQPGTQGRMARRSGIPPSVVGDPTRRPVAVGLG